MRPPESERTFLNKIKSSLSIIPALVGDGGHRTMSAMVAMVYPHLADVVSVNLVQHLQSGVFTK